MPPLPAGGPSDGISTISIKSKRSSRTFVARDLEALLSWLLSLPVLSAASSVGYFAVNVSVPVSVSVSVSVSAVSRENERD